MKSRRHLRRCTDADLNWYCPCAGGFAQVGQVLPSLPGWPVLYAACVRSDIIRTDLSRVETSAIRMPMRLVTTECHALPVMTTGRPPSGAHMNSSRNLHANAQQVRKGLASSWPQRSHSGAVQSAATLLAQHGRKAHRPTFQGTEAAVAAQHATAWLPAAAAPQERLLHCCVVAAAVAVAVADAAGSLAAHHPAENYPGAGAPCLGAHRRLQVSRCAQGDE